MDTLLELITKKTLSSDMLLSQLKKVEKYTNNKHLSPNKQPTFREKLMNMIFENGQNFEMIGLVTKDGYYKNENLNKVFKRFKIIENLLKLNKITLERAKIEKMKIVNDFEKMYHITKKTEKKVYID